MLLVLAVLAAAVMVVLGIQILDCPAQLTQALAVAVQVQILHLVATVVLVLLSFVTLEVNAALAVQLHRLAGTPSTHSHHLVHTQHDRRTQTTSCYVSERRIDALRSCT
jgi:hypothetical protein